MDVEVTGRIVRGLRAASGASRAMRRGTIALQLPYFRARIPGFDSFFDTSLHHGTLNVAVPRLGVEAGNAAFHVRDIGWERGTTEHFYLSPCTLRFSGRDYRGLIYMPDPATKPAGLPTGHVLEILTSRIAFIHYGSRVRLRFDGEAIRFVRPSPLRRPSQRKRSSASR